VNIAGYLKDRTSRNGETCKTRNIKPQNGIHKMLQSLAAVDCAAATATNETVEMNYIGA